MANATHQWLGAHPRYTLWQSNPAPPILLGCVREEENGMWTAYLSAHVVGGLGSERLRTCDDLTAACRTLCARLRVECPQVPTLVDEEDEP